MKTVAIAVLFAIVSTTSAFAQRYTEQTTTVIVGGDSAEELRKMGAGPADPNENYPSLEELRLVGAGPDDPTAKQEVHPMTPDQARAIAILLGTAK